MASVQRLVRRRPGCELGVRWRARKADPLNSRDLFGKQVTYVIPPFQRPYVWNKDDQWEPLWDDVQGAAESYLEALAAQDETDPDAAAAAAEQQAADISWAPLS